MKQSSVSLFLFATFLIILKLNVWANSKYFYYNQYEKNNLTTDTFDIKKYLSNYFPKSNNIYLKNELIESMNNGSDYIQNRIYQYYNTNGIYYYELIKNEINDTIGYNIIGAFIFEQGTQDGPIGKTTLKPHFISKDGNTILYNQYLLKAPIGINNTYIFLEPKFDYEVRDGYVINPPYSSFSYKPIKFKFYQTSAATNSLTQIFEFANSNRSKENEVYDFNIIYSNNQFSNIDKYFSFYCPRLSKNKLGIIDNKGNIIIEPEFKNISIFREEKLYDIFIVEKDQFFNYDEQISYGLLKSTGEFIFRPVFQKLEIDNLDHVAQNIELEDLKDDFGIFKYKGKYGFIDYKLNVKVEAKYIDYEIINNDYLLVQKASIGWGGYEDISNTYWTFLNIKNNTEIGVKIQEIRKDEIDQFDIFPVKIDHKWGYANKFGKITITPQFNFVTNFHEDVALVSNEVFEPSKKRRYSTFNVIDKTGRKLAIVPFEIGIDIQHVGYFSEGLIKYKSRANGLWGYLNKKGVIQIRPQFEECGFFFNGKAPIHLYGSLAFIDKNGNKINN